MVEVQRCSLHGKAVRLRMYCWLFCWRPASHWNKHCSQYRPFCRQPGLPRSEQPAPRTGMRLRGFFERDSQPAKRCKASGGYGHPVGSAILWHQLTSCQDSRTAQNWSAGLYKYSQRSAGMQYCVRPSNKPFFRGV